MCSNSMENLNGRINMTDKYEAQAELVTDLKLRIRTEPLAIRQNELKRELTREARILVRMQQYR